MAHGMAWIHHFHKDEGDGPEDEYIVITEDVRLVDAMEEFGEDGYELESVKVDVVEGYLQRLPTNRALRKEE